MELISLRVGILAVVIAINILLLIEIFRQDWRSATNRSFATLILVMSLWLVAAHLSVTPETNLFWSRLTIFFATCMSMLFFLLSHTLPHRALQLRRKKLLSVLISTFFVMIITLSPLAFIKVEIIDGSLKLITGPGMLAFGLLTTFFSTAAIYILFRKMKKAYDIEKQQLRFVLIGIFTMLGLIILTVLLPVVLVGSDTFVIFMPLYTLIFLSMTTYAILKHHLFNIKIIATEAFVGVLLILLFSRIFIAISLINRVVDLFTFLVTTVFGILLIRSVLKEVEQREQLQVLTTELEAANVELKKLDQTKSEFISIASHQLRAPLTVIKGYISLIREGSYGKIAAIIEDALSKVAFSTEQLVKLVSDMLNLSRMESGKIRYEFKPTDFVSIVTRVIEEFKSTVEKKGLTLEFINELDGIFTLSLDPDKMREVVVNLVDNGIKYTPKGTITVRLEKTSQNSVRLSVRDEGIGIKPEDMGRLFTKFVRTEDARRTDPNGTGIGLYFLKRVVEDHGGKAGVESEGLGKGSTFFVELPMK